jgi:Holliday junction resolvase RusA-like endonuclease
VIIVVIGRPQPAGSKRAFPIRRAGQVTGVAVVDDAKRSRPWKDSVAAAANMALAGSGDQMLGPLELIVDFYLARPAGHYGTGRNAGTVRPSAPAWPTTRPDATKLVRAVEDALTGLVWRDDAQVVCQTVRKHYGTPERAEINVRPYEPLASPADRNGRADG